MDTNSQVLLDLVLAFAGNEFSPKYSLCVCVCVSLCVHVSVCGLEQ